MKKKYQIPMMRSLLLHGAALMLGGSNTVTDYNRGSDINVGDSDEPTPSSSKRNYVDWGN